MFTDATIPFGRCSIVIMDSCGAQHKGVVVALASWLSFEAGNRKGRPLTVKPKGLHIKVDRSGVRCIAFLNLTFLGTYPAESF